MHNDVRLVHVMREHYTLFRASYICQTFIISCISVSIIIFLQYFRLRQLHSSFKNLQFQTSFIGLWTQLSSGSMLTTCPLCIFMNTTCTEDSPRFTEIFTQD